MNTLVDSISFNPISNSITSVDRWANYFIHMSEANSRAIQTVKSFESLPTNWDSYGATTPSKAAITKAISFILELSMMNLDVYFTAPSPNGDILVEVKHQNARVEFEFNVQEPDTVSAWHLDEISSENELNETTKYAYIKWLNHPNGTGVPNF